MKLPAQGNAFSNAAENSAPFFRRFYIYQKERFPLLGHGLLVAAFSFSAISYSRICRGAEGFVDLKTFAVGVFTTISLFLLVRIFDEFKDAEDDARFRQELPVPRGLVTYHELAWIGIVVVIAQIAVNLVFFPEMLLIYGVVVAYLTLMGKEFFVADWLKRHQFWYVTSHMFIIPLIDIYASGLDWLIAGVHAPEGLFFFFAVSYMNGIVLEVGRKIRAPEKESEGVLTYTSMLGAPTAIGLWLAVLAVTLSLSVAASVFAGYGHAVLTILGVVFLICALPAVLFLRNRTPKLSKMVEYGSALWTIAMYLTLGAGPMISKLLFH
ncbi:4-hydroxybenzoate polyprenyltransferase [Dyadobacter sp. SG02]|uniref:UbiA family prenyltransferase n=1 Tax=Dyadobacter sp. SG02 TaxID=1855291 RepID=UPI0008BF2594|nr:UbiA family prenyltransferase [Dyadobacter sp. SG02]SEJ58157.1 4-hydroxybenzoate polyprenyltransferase [Dyadobacter sp. SG02]